MPAYSLGATHAAFLAELDHERGLFRFGRVFLINPPVSLYNSMRILDDMIKKIPGGEEKFEQFFDEAFKAFSAIYQLSEPVDFTGDFLYRGRKPNDENLAALIGLSFRLSMANMVFTTDVFTNAGYIKPKNLQLSTTDSLTDYFNVADLVTFMDYFRDIFLPYFLQQTPGMTEQQLIDQLSLKSIEPFLRGSGSVFLVHNADDVTLAPGEIDYLRNVFGSRVRIYPHGGHCGNLTYRVNVADMLAVFKEVAVSGAVTGEAPPKMQDTAGAAEHGESASSPVGELHEPPPILSSEVTPAKTNSGESAPPSFTAPRPAVTTIGEVSEEIAHRVSAGPKSVEERFPGDYCCAPSIQGGDKAGPVIHYQRVRSPRTDEPGTVQV